MFADVHAVARTRDNIIHIKEPVVILHLALKSGIRVRVAFDFHAADRIGEDKYHVRPGLSDDFFFKSPYLSVVFQKPVK